MHPLMVCVVQAKSLRKRFVNSESISSQTEHCFKKYAINFFEPYIFSRLEILTELVDQQKVKYVPYLGFGRVSFQYMKARVQQLVRQVLYYHTNNLLNCLYSVKLFCQYTSMSKQSKIQSSMSDHYKIHDYAHNGKALYF